jgi:hypothetical protein
MPTDGIELDAIVAQLGRITRTGSNYVATLGALQCQTGQNVTAGTNWRGFLKYLTSSIPSYVSAEEIFLVYFRFRRRADPVGEPQTYALKISIGTWVGPTIDGNQAEFDGGTLVRTLSSKPADKQEEDLSSDGIDPVPLLNRSGQTDVKLWDDSTQGSGDASWGTNFNVATLTKCKLVVVWQIILLTATGTGSASCGADIVRLGSAVATANGEAELAARAIYSADGLGTGEGSAALLAGLLLSSAHASRTGSGSTQLLAGIIIATARSEVTGVAFLSGKGSLLLSARGQGIGSGLATMIAGMIWSAVGRATGVGSASISIPFPALAVDDRIASPSPVDSRTCAWSGVHLSEPLSVARAHSATREPRR